MAISKVISAFPGTIYGSLMCLNSKVSNQYQNRGKLLIVFCYFSYTVWVHHDNKNVQCNAYYTWVDVDILTGMYGRHKQWDCSYLSLLNIWRQFFRYIHWNNAYATWMRIWIGKISDYGSWVTWLKISEIDLAGRLSWVLRTSWPGNYWIQEDRGPKLDRYYRHKCPVTASLCVNTKQEKILWIKLKPNISALDKSIIFCNKICYMSLFLNQNHILFKLRGRQL